MSEQKWPKPDNSPLGVMRRAMEQHLREGRLGEATALAKALAPYEHPRVLSVSEEQLRALRAGPAKEPDYTKLTDAELDQLVAILEKASP
jgi:hypothetical protein